MSETVKVGPLMKEILASGISLDAPAVCLTFFGADGAHYRLDIASSCAALTLAALAGEMGRLAAAAPTASVQPVLIEGKSIDLRMADDGRAVFALRLRSGATLPLIFEGTDLFSIRDLVDEAIAMKGGTTGRSN